MEKQLSEIKEYIDSTMEDIDVLMGKSRRFAKLQFLVLVTMMITIFSPLLILWVIVFNIWVFLLIHEHWTISRPLARKFGEIHGCFKTLRILGLLDESPPDAPKKKSKKWFEKMYEETRRIIEGIKWKPQQGFT